MKGGNDWVTVANGAADARDLLRSRLLPDVRELMRIAGDKRTRELATRIHDAAFAATVRLTIGLKGRSHYDLTGEKK